MSLRSPQISVESLIWQWVMAMKSTIWPFSMWRQAVRYGGIYEWEKMLEIFQNSPSPSAKISAMSGNCFLVGDFTDMRLSGLPWRQLRIQNSFKRRLSLLRWNSAIRIYCTFGMVCMTTVRLGGHSPTIWSRTLTLWVIRALVSPWSSIKFSTDLQSLLTWLSTVQTCECEWHYHNVVCSPSCTVAALFQRPLN